MKFKLCHHFDRRIETTELGARTMIIGKHAPSDEMTLRILITRCRNIAAGFCRHCQSRSSLRDESAQHYRSSPSDFMKVVAFTAASRFRRGATSDFDDRGTILAQL